MKELIVEAWQARFSGQGVKLDEEPQISFLKSEYISYANCGLPYYFGGAITDKSGWW
jgi:hypothetical protein